ncbi:MAG: hypothetical protein EKK41_27405 [Hyphomicrobiales bacterium]|nr:MAG: hypothetical protein EKK41_27405 [Hyphomicrobiales bacterium]
MGRRDADDGAAEGEVRDAFAAVGLAGRAGGGIELAISGVVGRHLDGVGLRPRGPDTGRRRSRCRRRRRRCQAAARRRRWGRRRRRRAFHAHGPFLDACFRRFARIRAVEREQNFEQVLLLPADLAIDSAGLVLVGTDAHAGPQLLERRFDVGATLLQNRARRLGHCLAIGRNEGLALGLREAGQTGRQQRAYANRSK